MATEQKQDTVTFFNVQKSYPPGEQLNIGYTLDSELKRSKRDWVGLFRVGWSSSRDYYTFEWAPVLADSENLRGEVTFAGRRLPPEDNHFYQFCYVTSDGRVRGASSPFQFLAVSLARVDDLELVEMGEESLLILQPKKKDDFEMIKLNTANEALRCEKEQLTKQLDIAEKDSAAKLKERDDQISELDRQLVSKRESEQRLLEKLDNERGVNQELDAAKKELEQAKNELEQRLVESLERERMLNEELAATKTDTESKIGTLQQQLAEKDTEIKSTKDENAALKAEISDLKGQLQIKNAQVEDLSQLASTRGEEKEELAKETEQLQERLLEVQRIRADLIEEKEAQQVELDRLMAELDAKIEDIERLNKQIDELKQDVACAEENVAELMGAGANAVVVVNQPVATPADHDEPPTQPPTKAEIVDKAAYDALLQAYESLEEDLKKSKETKLELSKKLQIAEAKCEEMIARLSQARDQYQALARESYELKKRAGGGDRSPQPPSEKPLEKQIKEMESINKELVASCEVASQQLSSRKEEMKRQQVKIEQLEGELAAARQQLEDFQDKHDKVVHAKTEALDKQQAVLDQKLKEVVDLQQARAKLEGTVHQLRSQLESLKAAATTADRTCPICGTKFPGRISQADYERHVNGHFP